jgi:excinuclease ABC subunit B
MTTTHQQQFKIAADFEPRGDQPEAIAKLAKGVWQGIRHQTLLGVTGSGKTYTMAKIVEAVQKPTLVIAHNKTLAAQLYTEFRDFFPHNAVEYFVSYYNYYQPEAYVPHQDLYIEKDADINDEIDKLRHAATRSLMTRKDVLIVASVSCIYGLGSPQDYYGFVESLCVGKRKNRNRLVRRLIEMQYERNDYDLARARFRIRGDTLEIMPAYEEKAVRIEFFGDEIERIVEMDALTGEVLASRSSVDIYPARHFVTSADKMETAIVDIQKELTQRLMDLKAQGKLLEAQRLEQRTRYDLEMLQETGYCGGVENYSCHLGQRHHIKGDHLAESCGSTPWTLLDYFPDDFLLFIDESHMTVPQLRGMYHGDSSRKQNLVDYGFRLPSAKDNRPLSFDEFEVRVNQTIYVSATPSPYEFQQSIQVVEQAIRPTGLLDPTVEIKPTEGQIDDLLYQIGIRSARGERCLVTTLTKRMAEELTDYLKEMNIKVHHLHSEINTLERSEILRDLRLGVYDVVVGINLLREGLDLPEVSLVAILDADKEGYLRSESALIQTAGRAARHIDGHVIMYANLMTNSMRRAIDVTSRRREMQKEFNRKNGITPQGIKKAIRDITERVDKVIGSHEAHDCGRVLDRTEIYKLIKELESQMKRAAKDLEFERASLLRDEVLSLRRLMADDVGRDGS